MVAEWRRCPSCGLKKDAAEFHKDTMRGAKGRCAVCRKAPPVHPPGTKFCRVCWVRKPLSEFVVSTRRMTGTGGKCIPCNRVYQATWRRERLGQIRETSRAWTAANLAYFRAYRAAHPEERRRINEQWRRRHPLVVQAGAERYRGRKASNGGDFTSAEWIAMSAAQGGRCLCCGMIARLQMDHVVPISLGGRHEASNIQGLCRACNRRKGTQIIDYR